MALLDDSMDCVVADGSLTPEVLAQFVAQFKALRGYAPAKILVGPVDKSNLGLPDFIGDISLGVFPRLDPGASKLLAHW